MSKLPPLRTAISKNPWAVVLLGGFGVLCLWTYWPILSMMADRWTNDPQYSHGFLVPLFAVVLLVLRRELLDGVTWDVAPKGLWLIAVGAAMYVFGGVINFDWAQAASLIVTLAGLVVLFGGWAALRWAWPALLFLGFMIPLPFRVEYALGGPLQRLATIGSTFILQTVGLPAIAEGNIIILENGRIGVVEACSGLSMMLVFFALATAFVIIVQRPLLETLILLFSAIPIAVVVNILRISITGMAHDWISPEMADKIFHDWAGWLMMPTAVFLLWLELWILSRLVIEVPVEEPVDVLGAVAPQDTPPDKRGPNNDNGHVERQEVASQDTPQNKRGRHEAAPHAL